MRTAAALACLIIPCFLLLAGQATVEAAKAVDGVVNLNTAPVEVLALLPGIGPAKAAAILVYRKRRPFRTVDELVRIKGVGRKMVRRLRMHLAVAGPTTATTGAVKAGLTVVAEPPKPAPAAAHAPHPPTCSNPPSVARVAHPTGPLARARARTAGQERSRARPWPAPCLGPP